MEQSLDNAILDDKPKKGFLNNKKVVWISSGIVVAALISAAVVTPQIMRNSMLNEYDKTIEELNITLAEVAEADALGNAELALSALQYEEATAFAKRLSGFGDAPDYAISPENANSLSDAGKATLQAIGEIDLTDPESKLVESVKKVISEDKDPSLPKLYAMTTSDDMLPYIVSDEPKQVKPLPHDDVTDESLGEARQDLEDAKNLLQEEQAYVDDQLAIQAKISDSVSETLKLLSSTAETLPDRAKSASSTYSKAGDANNNMTSTAESSAKFAVANEYTLTDNGDIEPAEKGKGKVDLTESAKSILLSMKIESYVDSAKKAKESHEAAEAAEVAAAEQAAAEAAAASGSGGYMSPSTGQWVATAPSGGGGSWSGGGSSSGGSTAAPSSPSAPSTGGSTGGGSTGGSTGNGATMSYNPWASQPNGGCPSGTYPTGSWSNYGPGCAQNGNLGW